MMEVPENLVITVQDANLAGHCGRGMKDWITSKGYNVRAVFREGIPAPEMAAMNDGIADSILRHVLARIERGER